MPSIGLGTYELCGQKGVKIMQNALQIGYRFFDTAQMYKNEKELNLQNLGLEYVDLLVIHEPYENTKEMYQACEEAYRKGLTRTIEVLNFYGRYFRGFFRFWLDKGLFPFIERDENDVRYFAKSDIGWVDCLRSCNMSIKDIKHYINLTTGGMKTAKERKELLERHFKILSKELEILHIAHKKWK
ncbi:aldo/keto reductase [Campylobacter upsaliensis]|uniref:aldo/keto reductase n=1 Tax=Campylobacter upsaliensis TaxID=28080 RepID=UPI0022EB0A45|nr:aldo/keto reductase [Campylobacter upsaliensis]MEB2801090.1 aldo/keto reductase [Campylobacter upsaliensis]MEB2809992.1 aldo/keto reductase [Campylobacter upsaliensis]